MNNVEEFKGKLKCFNDLSIHEKIQVKKFMSMHHLIFKKPKMILFLSFYKSNWKIWWPI